jgi:hypothetical protein
MPEAPVAPRAFAILERMAAVAVAAEAVAVAGWGAATVVSWAGGAVEDGARAGFIAVFALLAAAALLLVARGLWRSRARARGAAFVWQVLQAAVGVAAMGGSFWWGMALLLPVPVVIVGVVAAMMREQIVERGLRP